MNETLQDVRSPGRHRAPGILGGLFSRNPSNCRRGEHRYGSPQPIGAGIIRQRCLDCESVTIDIRDAEVMIAPRLFAGQRPRLAANRRRTAPGRRR